MNAVLKIKWRSIPNRSPQILTPADSSSESRVYAGGFGRGDDTVGKPHRAQISQFELFELVLLLKLNKRFPVEQFEAAVSQSTVITVPSPPSKGCP